MIGKQSENIIQYCDIPSKFFLLESVISLYLFWYDVLISLETLEMLSVITLLAALPNTSNILLQYFHMRKFLFHKIDSHQC